jgi:hypothetical protein
VAVGAWPAGYLVAFDGTDQIPANHWDVPQGFIAHYQSANRDYVPGIGSVSNPHQNPFGGDPLETAFAFGAAQAVENEYMKLANFYQSDKNRRTVPLDIVGYSRGCYQAAALAAVINDDGIPDLTSYDYGQQHWEKLPGPAPKVRFLGLDSPVGQFGGDPFITVLTLGLIAMNLGWPSSIPPNVQTAIQLSDNNPNDPIYRQQLLSLLGSSASGLVIPMPEDKHGQIGQDPAALEKLLAAARQCNVPVDDPPVSQLESEKEAANAATTQPSP